MKTNCEPLHLKFVTVKEHGYSYIIILFDEAFKRGDGAKF
jgi:hypothetical protein